jgi:magnesium-transporting ATPase (P-type)
MLRILLLSAAVALTIGVIVEGSSEGWIEGASILFAVFFFVILTAGNNYFKEKRFQKLKAQQ